MSIESSLHDNEGRVIRVRIKYKEHVINILNIYAPTIPSERKQFMSNIWQYKTGDNNLILGGDFNCVEEPSLDKLGGNPTSSTAGIEELKDFTWNNDLLDVWKQQHPTDRLFTWSNKDFSLRSRLDRWYIPIKLCAKARSCIWACPVSDHSAVEVYLELINTRGRGRGVWKLNNSILEDKAFQREIQHVHTFWKAKSH